MSTKPVLACALLMMVSVCAAQGQEYTRPKAVEPDLGDPNVAPVAELDKARPTVVWPPQTGASAWITGIQPCCCGPVGGCGPIKMELFVNTGPSRPLGEGFLGHSLSTGWMIGGGGRSMFFDTDRQAAWSIDGSLNEIENNGGHPNLQTAFKHETFDPVTGNISVDFPNISVAALHRTYLKLGGGREWWLIGCADNGDKSWTCGADLGAIYGVARLDMHDWSDEFGQFQRFTHVMYGPYAALYTNCEVPCNCCTYSFGFRCEWDYMDSRLLPFNKADIFDVNFLLTAGVRF
jgi:hypothetical protein